MTEETRHLDPDEALSLVGEEKRFAIVEALWNAEGRELAFSELREAVGIRDSGQFNYHLDKLTEAFVRKTDDGTYTLRHAGELVVGAVLSGGYTRAVTVDPISLDGTCPECGGGLVATYEEDLASVECSDCEIKLTQFSVPPGILDGYEPAAYPQVFDRWIKSTMFQSMRGFCRLCMGRLRARVTETALEGANTDVVSVVGAEFECDRCGATSQTVLSGALMDRPAVVSFAHDHGIDLWRTPMWELDWLTTADTEIRSEDPVQAHLTYELDDERLELTVDDELEVVSVERSRPNA